ncbi:hypothetical protein BKA63DRAFT_23175 [Paraphoma chrysanthemicola]|nr:hypothetical protein BKA63DRAFT_23175 [Paraphoma chrysanthemicola]
MVPSSFLTLLLPVLSTTWLQACASQAVTSARLDLPRVDLGSLNHLGPPANEGQEILEGHPVIQPPDYHTMPPRSANPPQPTTSAWKNLFARQNQLVCTIYTSSGRPWGCTAPDSCCSGGGSTWCCSNIYNCGNTGRCAYAYTSTTTVVTTSTVSADVTSTNLVSAPGGTQYSTTFTTTVVYVTRSDLQTATVVSTITITSDQRKRQALTDIPSATNAPAIPTQSPIQLKEKIPEDTQQAGPIETATSPRQRIELFKRQNIKVTATETTYRAVYITQVRTVAITRTSSYTVTSLRTSTYTTTSTSAINARTTVTSTSTVIVNANGQQVNNANTNSNNNNGGSGGGGGGGGSSKALSTGAKAGIGAGTGAGSLIICLLLGFCIKRRRKQKKAEVADLINQAVAAATTNNAPAGNPYLPPAGAAGVMTENKHPNTTIQPQPYGLDNRGSYQTVTSPPPPMYRYSHGQQGQQGGYEMDGSSVGQSHSPQPVYAQQYQAYSPGQQSYAGSPQQPQVSPEPQMGYEMAATYSPQAGHVQPVQPMQGVGQQGMHEMYHDPNVRR